MSPEGLCSKVLDHMPWLLTWHWSLWPGFPGESRSPSSPWGRQSMSMRSTTTWDSYQVAGPTIKECSTDRWAADTPDTGQLCPPKGADPVEARIFLDCFAFKKCWLHLRNTGYPSRKHLAWGFPPLWASATSVHTVFLNQFINAEAHWNVRTAEASWRNSIPCREKGGHRSQAFPELWAWDLGMHMARGRHVILLLFEWLVSKPGTCFPALISEVLKEGNLL